MWNLVKGLALVQQDYLNLFLSVEAVRNLRNNGYKLRLTGALVTKSELAVKYFVSVIMLL